MTSALSGIQSAIDATARAAATLVGAFSFKEFLGIGDSYQRAIIQMQVMWGTATDDMIARAKKMSDDFGKYFGFTEISQAMIRTKDVMATLGVSTQQYFDLLQRAGDVGAVKVMGLEEAMRFVEKAALGNKKAGMELGVVVTDDYMKYTAFGGKLAETWQKLDEGSKAYYRVQEVMRQTTQYMDQAKNMAATTLSGAMRMLGETIKEELGPSVATVVRDIAGTIGSIAPPIKAVAESISSLLSVYNSFPDEVKGAAGTGLILRILTGSWAPAQLLTFLSLIDGSMKEINKLTGSNMPTSDVATSAYAKLQNAWKAFQGGEDSMKKYFQQQYAGGDTVGRTHVEGKLPAPPGTDMHQDVFKPDKGMSGSELDSALREMEKKLGEVKKQFSDLFDDIQIQLAKMSGDTFKAESVAIDKWATDTSLKTWKMISEAQGKYNDMQAKVKEKGGDDSVNQKLAQAQAELNTTWEIGLGIIKQYIPEMTQLKIQEAQLRDNSAIAGVKVSYAQLTGTMEDQLRAQLALIEANAQEKLGIDWKTKVLVPLGQAYRDLYMEQERLASLRIDGSAWDGFNEGLKEWQHNLPTAFDMGKKAVDTLKTSIDSAAGALADFTMTGKMDFTNFANSIIKDILKMIYTAELNQGVNGLLGWLGLGASSSSTSSSWTAPTVTLPAIFGGATFATGGNYPVGQDILVGEQGPEIVRLNTPGRIIPNSQIGSGGHTINTVINTNISVPSGTNGGGGMSQQDMEKLAKLVADSQTAQFNNNLQEQMRSRGLLNQGLNT
jgi:hypothetical protein